MKHPKMNIRLVASKEMDAAKNPEHNRIRMPKKTREAFENKGNRLELNVNNKTGIFYIYKALKKDIALLAKQRKEGKITEEQIQQTGFVTTETLKRFVGRRRKNLEEICWVTDDISALMIGADPEFCLVGADGRFKYAQSVNGLSFSGQLGHDGPLAEIRPTASTSVEDLVGNISNIFKNKSNAIRALGWMGGASYINPKFKNTDRVPHIGGHIHLGDPSLLPDRQRVATYNRLTQVLDEMVAAPLVRIDGPEAHRRRHSNYGKYGDHKVQQGRFEWRVPSGLWLIHPEIARAVLGVTKAVTEASYMMISDKGFKLDWTSAPNNQEGFLQAWGAAEPEKIKKIVNDAKPDTIKKPFINKTKKKLTSLPTYKNYKPEIDDFIKIVGMSRRDRNKLNYNLKDTWLDNGPLIKK